MEELGFTHLSAGDLLRDKIKKDSECSQKIKDIIREGELVPPVSDKMLRLSLDYYFCIFSCVA